MDEEKKQAINEAIRLLQEICKNNDCTCRCPLYDNCGEFVMDWDELGQQTF